METDATMVHVAKALQKCLPEKLETHIEVEIRLGTVMEKSTGQRLQMGLMHACVIKKADTLFFQATVEEQDYARIVEYYKEKIGKPGTKKIVDTLVKGYRRSETKEIDGKTVAEKAVLIKKTKMDVVDIHCPDNKYDIRISISKEVVQEDMHVLPAAFAVREKHRQTFAHRTYIVDATEVVSSRAQNKKQDTAYEVEIEAVNTEYTRSGFTHTVLDVIEQMKDMLKAKK